MIALIIFLLIMAAVIGAAAVAAVIVLGLVAMIICVFLNPAAFSVDDILGLIFIVVIFGAIFNPKPDATRPPKA